LDNLIPSNLNHDGIREVADDFFARYLTDRQ